jgi:hypothetical protein
VSLGCALSSACGFGPSASEKAEAGIICRAVDTLRDAPNAAKQRLFAALQSAPCQNPDLCALKQLCVSGYEQHLRGLEQTARAKALLGESGSDAEAAKALDAAQAALKQAAPLLSRCADDEGAAQRKYRP